MTVPAIRRTRLLRATAALSAAGLVLTGCGGASSSGGGAGDQVTVENCGAQVTVDRAPERVVMLDSAAAPALHALGVMDRVTAKAGPYPLEIYSQSLQQELQRVPSMEGSTNQTGHLQISRDAVVAQQPDLVVGASETVPRQTLSDLGIPLIEEPAYCPGGLKHPTFDSVSDQLRVYGEIFGRQDQAEQAIADLRQRVQAVRAQVQASGRAGERSAAVLYPTVGGGPLYAYGAHSMAAPQLEAAGLDNVFAQTDQRVFEVSAEELLARNPDKIVLLHADGDPEQVRRSFEQQPGADQLKAVRTGEVMVEHLNMVEPATPQSVTGLEQIVERFGA